ncbi:MAG: DUF4838 domain-containing protein [Phycisphaeraceae bacterium]
MRIQATVCMITFFLAGLAGCAMAESRTVVADGKSAYSIFRDPAAPRSVVRASSELQTYIAKATGVKLPIITARAPEGSPMICLGVNEASIAAGLDKGLPEYGFRIATVASDIFILGQDTLDGQERWTGDARQGTLLGTFGFLEKVVNVRWLMPGDVGEDVPHTDRLVVDDLNVTETPSIQYRWLIGIKDERPDVAVWKARNKVDVKQRGAGINASHSFNSFPSEKARKDHPEILAVKKDGSPARMDKQHMMYCLSKPILYDLFAQDIMDAFEQNPRLYSMSMSPDEGSDWCQCPDCAALTTQPTEQWKDLGVGIPQHTAAVLRFYNEVARRVGAKYPDRKLGGFIYQAYMEPLPQPVGMEPNIVFSVAMNTNYGFKLYQPKRQAIFQQFFDEWGKYGAQMGYYSYDTWMRNWFGMPLPPARPLLKWNFPMFKRNNVQHLLYFGQEAWGYGAVHNYMVARLMWHADADVDALYHEFLTRAYGAEAAPLIGRMFDLVDESLQAYIQSKPRPDHEIDYAAAKAIYGSIWPRVEELYLEALATTAEGSPQRARLEMLGDNLIQAHFHMWKAKLLPDDVARQSPLFKGTDELEEWIAQKEKGLSIIHVAQWVKTYGYYDMPVLRPNWRPK